jgi:hypothetical protein
MSKKFKNFRNKSKEYEYEDEWGDFNEERIQEKQRGKKRKQKVNEGRNRKHMNFKDFRDS